MGNTNEIPFTEIVERTQKLARAADNVLGKIRGVVNDVYTREIPAKFDWNFLLASSSLTSELEKHDGTVSLNTGDTTVKFESTTVDNTIVGKKIKFGGNDVLYDITVYTNSTTCTISPALQGATNLSSASYSLYQPFYSLAKDFDRFPKPGGVYRWSGGRKQILPESQYANYVNDFYQTTAAVPFYTRLFGTDTKGNIRVELIPAPKDQRVYGYDYLFYVTPLFETTMGTVTISANGTSVSGSSTEFLRALTDGSCFMRVDNFGKGEDSNWYRILSVSSNSDMTLATAFANSAVAGANVTIAQAPKFPYRLHMGLVYGALRALTLDENDPNAAFFHQQYASVLSDAKKIYVSRPYSQDVTGIFEDYRYRR